ncbi:MAG: hypothetical protein QF473_38930 [Planctomycetota bacterium]|nr:hypothetical protein [Planctomycetota bacterium]
MAPDREFMWMAWFGHVSSSELKAFPGSKTHLFTLTDDAEVYRSKAGPKCIPANSILGFSDKFRGQTITAFPKKGLVAFPDRTGVAYSFHIAAKGHNSAKYPLWVRPLKKGRNTLYATVHQRFVYHLMFRLTDGHYARYQIDQSKRLSGMNLPYSILLLERSENTLKIVARYEGVVKVVSFPTEDLRKGAGVTVESVEVAPELSWTSSR